MKYFGIRLALFICKYFWHHFITHKNEHGVLTHLICTRCGSMINLFGYYKNNKNNYCISESPLTNILENKK